MPKEDMTVLVDGARVMKLVHKLDEIFSGENVMNCVHAFGMYMVMTAQKGLLDSEPGRADVPKMVGELAKS